MPRAWVAILLVAGCGFSVRPGDDPNQPPGTDAPMMPDALEVVPTLIDAGLVVRYFMDEASTGRGPTELIDSAPAPLNLPITYGQVTYVEHAGNRGLHWPSALGTGKVEIGLGTAKLSSTLRVVTTTTMEVVVDVDSADLTTSGHIAGLRGLNPDLLLSAIGADGLQLHRPYNSLTATWLGADERQRMVLHVVYDANHADPEQRVSLFKNGALVAKTTTTPPPMGESSMLSTSVDLIIGNSQSEDRSFGGTVYYLAFYDRSLTGAEVANNAQRLFANDDR